MNAALLEAPSQPGGESTISRRDPDALYEIIDGNEVELPPMSVNAGVIASRLARKISYFTESKNLGETYNEILIKLNLPDDRDRSRRPDFIYVSYEKWGRDLGVPDDASWNIVPDLCVEVISPSDNANEIEEKIDEYFESGVRQVWVVYPFFQKVRIHKSPTDSITLTSKDTLLGGNIIPDFELPLSQLFATAKAPVA